MRRWTAMSDDQGLKATRSARRRFSRLVLDRDEAKKVLVRDVKPSTSIILQELESFEYEGQTVESPGWGWEGEFLVTADGVLARFTFDEDEWQQGWEFGVMHKAITARAAQRGDVRVVKIVDRSEMGQGRTLTWSAQLAAIGTVFEAYEAACAIEHEVHDPLRRVRQAMKDAVAAELAALDARADDNLDVLLRRADAATERVEKGRTLEKLISALLQTVQGFSLCDANVRTETEEIDISLWNNRDSGFWRKEQALVLVECKNWSARVTKNELVAFREKVRNRRGRCSVGILVAWNGITEDAATELLRTSHESPLVLLLEGEHVREAVAKGTIDEALTTAWKAATFQ